MSEIKPIDWDSLPKIWGFDHGKTEEAMQGIYIKYEAPYGYGIFTMEYDDIQFFEHISETDPRIKAPKMRVMTAEELNDIYWSHLRNFRVKYVNGAKGFGVIFDVGTNLHSMEYSTDRGKTWNKCEVAE